jgi:signal peptidase
VRAVFRRLGGILPVLLALPFVALVVLLGTAAVLDWQVRGVVTNSMAPDIAKGSLVVVTPVDGQIRAGMVIAFPDALDSARTVIHRVVDVVETGDRISYRTKGDANERADAHLVAREKVIGRIRWDAPALGTWLDRMRTGPVAAILIGIPVAAVLADIALRRRPGSA